MKSRLARKLESARARKAALSLERRAAAQTRQERRNSAIQSILSVSHKPHLLILDVDGTIVNFRRRLYEDLEPRPFLGFFLRKVSRLFDVVLYSRASSEHVEFVRRRWCDKYVKIGLSRDLNCSDIKYVDELLEAGRSLWIVDDNPDSFCLTHRKHLVKIAKWTRDFKRDRELLRVADVLIAKAQAGLANPNK